MPVLLHGVSQRLSPRVLAGENLQFAAAILVEPLDAPFPRRLAILENVGRLSAGLARLCHHVSGSELSKGVPALAGLLLRLRLVDGAFRVNVELRARVERAVAMCIER